MRPNYALMFVILSGLILTCWTAGWSFGGSMRSFCCDANGNSARLTKIP